MERYFYLAVKLAAAGYILYKVWLLIFRDRLFGLWDRIPVRAPRLKSEAKPSAPARKGTTGVVGRTSGGYLADPAPALEPVLVIPVEPEADGVAENDPEEEFEVGPAMGHPSDEELYGAGNEQPHVTDSSTGWTYEQLTDAVAYAAAPVDDDEPRRMRAAETMSLIHGSTLFEIIERQFGNMEAIGLMEAERLDGERSPRRGSVLSEEQLASFDAGDYI